MAQYIKVTEEAMQAMDALSGNVRELLKDILEAAKHLINTYEENSDGLGRHNDSIKNLLESLAQFSGDEEKSKTLVKRLKLQKKLIEKHIEINNHNRTGPG